MYPFEADVLYLNNELRCSCPQCGTMLEKGQNVISFKIKKDDKIFFCLVGKEVSCCQQKTIIISFFSSTQAADDKRIEICNSIDQGDLEVFEKNPLIDISDLKYKIAKLSELN